MPPSWSLATVCSIAWIVLGLLVPPANGQEHAEKAAPWDGVRWPVDGAAARPEVRIEDRWYRLVAIEGEAAQELVDFCEKTWPGKARKRFEEDLVEVLVRRGKSPGKTVDVRAVDLETKKEVRFAELALSAEKREALRRTRAEAEAKAVAPPVGRVRREHAKKPDARYAALASAPKGAARGPTLARAEAEEDLDQLEYVLQEHFAYRDRLGVDWAAALDTLRTGLPAEVAATDLAVRIARLIALGGDAHAEVSLAGAELLQSGYAPFLLGDCGTRVVAFLHDRSGFVSDERPVLTAIDGVPLERWIEVASSIVPRGSPQFVRRGALRNLRNVAWLRAELGLAAKKEIELELASLDGKKREKKKLPLAERRPTYGEWPRTSSRRLEGGFGYLRIAAMDGDEAFIAGVEAELLGFADTPGLVIDVRGNGGGSRALLRVLLPVFLRAGDPPRVVNAARPRIGAGTACDATEGCLADRFAFPAASKRWGSGARRELEALAQDFEAEWKPDERLFGPWHWFAIARDAADERPAYAKRVVVLLDATCFSATDIFLGGFQGLPDVTLIGTPSGGGSSRAVDHELAHSRLRIRLASMCSYRADGRLYDGRGIEPDVHVEAEPTDFLGRTDAQLDAALAHLRAKK